MTESGENMNAMWGSSDKVKEQGPADEIVEAATRDFVKLVGRDPYSRDELLKFFTKDRETSLWDREYDGKLIPRET